jgi:4-alpha-glucanotransferase
MDGARHAGLLIPIFSMPSSRSWGIGEIADIVPMAGWLRQAGQDILQLLPINEMATGQESPYSAMSAMAIDPIFISLHQIEDFRALGGEDSLDPASRDTLRAVRASRTIDYAAVRSLKERALRSAFRRFRDTDWARDTPRASALRGWSEEQRWWLDDYALFRALHAREQDRAWTSWPEPLRARKPAALEAARAELADEVLYRRYLQWIADTQWRTAREQAAPVGLFGDLPFMVDVDSADVWANQDSFRLDASVGAPPDAFSATGQNWGLPVYDWAAIARHDFRWPRLRARRSAALYSGYRVDHLVGFYRTFIFPRDGSTPCFTPARQRAQLALGRQMLRVFAEPGARIIAEDLGTVPDFVRASLARLGIPGFKVLRWEREWKREGRPFRDPKAYPVVSVATTGTHDTEPLAVWWSEMPAEERAKVGAIPSLRQIAPKGVDLESSRFTPQVRDALLELLFASASELLILPVQDVFGWRERINVPAKVVEENWTYRLPWPSDRLDLQPEAVERAETLRRWARRHKRGVGGSR